MMERQREPYYHYSSHYRHLCPLTPPPPPPHTQTQRLLVLRHRGQHEKSSKTDLTPAPSGSNFVHCTLCCPLAHCLQPLLVLFLDINWFDRLAAQLIHLKPNEFFFVPVLTFLFSWQEDSNPGHFFLSLPSLPRNRRIFHFNAVKSLSIPRQVPFPLPPC